MWAAWYLGATTAVDQAQASDGVAAVVGQPHLPREGFAERSGDDTLGIVARGRHAIVRHQTRKALCQVINCCLVEIAERCRQAIAAMFFGHTAKRPQRIL